MPAWCGHGSSARDERDDCVANLGMTATAQTALGPTGNLGDGNPSQVERWKALGSPVTMQLPCWPLNILQTSFYITEKKKQNKKKTTKTCFKSLLFQLTEKQT